jgi:hypothetical protein
MNRIKAFTVVLALLAMAACGGSGAADKGKPEEKTGIGRIIAERSAGDELRPVPSKGSSAGGLRISAVRLSTDNLYANTDLNAEVEVAPPVPEGVSFEYRWYITNQEVADANGPTLKGGTFRKHQWVFCEARAMTGNKVSDWLKSDFVRIANSPPQVESVSVESFTVPGKFRYQIKASDIDNDELTYELISPLDAGIALDKKSGLLTWSLDNALVEKLGEKIEISISVSDSDAQPTTGSLTLRFQKKTTTPNP